MKAQRLLALASVSVTALLMGCQQSSGPSAEAGTETQYTAPAASASVGTAAAAPSASASVTTQEPAYQQQPQAEANVSAGTAGYTQGQTGEFSVPAMVRSETTYTTNPPAQLQKPNMLQSGETVYVRPGALESAAQTGWVPAKTSDGREIYIHASDLKLK